MTLPTKNRRIHLDPVCPTLRKHRGFNSRGIFSLVPEKKVETVPKKIRDILIVEEIYSFS